MRVAAVLCAPDPRPAAASAALVHLEHPDAGHFTDAHLEALRPLFEVAGPILEALQARPGARAERDRLRDSETRYRGEAEESRQLLASEWSFGRFVGRSAAVRELEAAVRKAAATDVPGADPGRDRHRQEHPRARAPLRAGRARTRPLVTVFCPSLERGMVEAELFGHRRGAFTGAQTDRAGKVQAAEGGTLFLDEIGELPLEIQPKLLRLLQEKTYERVGDPEERRADVRVIAATNRDLEQRGAGGPLPPRPLRAPQLPAASACRRCASAPRTSRCCCATASTRPTPGAGSSSAPRPPAFLRAARLRVAGQRAPHRAARRAAHDGGPAGHRSRRPTWRGCSTRANRAAASGDAGRRSGPTSRRACRGCSRSPSAAWLEEALRRYPKLTRAELAARLKISESRSTRSSASTVSTSSDR